MGVEVDSLTDIDSAKDCLNLCLEETECEWSTFDESDGICTLTEDCIAVNACDSCTVSNINNPECETDDNNDDGMRC